MSDRDLDEREPLPALRDEEAAGLTAETRLKYQRIAGMIRDLAEPPPEPSDLWRQRVLAAMEAQRPRKRPWRAAAWIGVAAAAGVAIYLALRPAPGTEPALVAEIVPSGKPHLGESGPGVAYRDDTLILRAAAAGAAEIRVYDERGRLIGRCGDSAAPGCTASRDRDRREYRLELKLEQLGLTRPLLIVGDRLPATTGEMNKDLEATSSLRVVPLPPIKVL